MWKITWFFSWQIYSVFNRFTFTLIHVFSSVILAVIGLFTLTGCGSNENGEQNTDTKTVETKEKSSKTSNEFKIKDVAFKFDHDVTFKDFN